jgi:hypothetical protein
MDKDLDKAILEYLRDCESAFAQLTGEFSKGRENALACKMGDRASELLERINPNH